ncbi:MAG: hypothetical protein ACKPKO_60465, partial [Candidatus Fonsibacter sp.]
VQTQVGALLDRPEVPKLQDQMYIRSLEAGMEHLEFHNFDAPTSKPWCCKRRVKCCKEPRLLHGR